MKKKTRALIVAVVVVAAMAVPGLGTASAVAGAGAGPAAPADAEGGTQGISPAGPEEVVLPSGIRALLAPRPGSGAVFVAVAVRAGSQDEPPEMAGLSHYLEHLLFDGFDGHDERWVTEAFERHAAYVNAFTREQSTVFFVLAPPSEARAAAELLCGMLTRSDFAPGTYEKERGVILEELAKDMARPSGVHGERLRRALWRGTPLERPVLGTRETVRATTRDQVIAYWKRHYVPAGMSLMVIGDLPPGDLRDVARPFAELAGGGPSPATRPWPGEWPGWGTLVTVPDDSGEDPELALVVVPPRDVPGDAPLEVLARWLDAADGPLHRALVPGWAVALSVSRLPRAPVDLLEIRVHPAKDVAPAALAARVLGALRAAAGGPSDADALRLDAARRAERVLVGQRLHYSAVYYGEEVAAGHGPMADVIAPRPVDPEGVRRVARAVLASPRARAAFAGPGVADATRPLPEPVAPEAAAAPGAAWTDGPFGARVTTLPNGLVLGVLEEPGNAVFGIHLLVADRSLREPADRPGIADLAHRLLAAGSHLSPPPALARRIERLGLDVKTSDNPFIPFDDRYHVPRFSYVRIEGPAGGLADGLELLAEALRQPAWDEAAWQRAVRGLGMARRSAARGSARAGRLLRQALLGRDHPLARSASGLPGDPVPTPDEVRAFWGTWPSGYFAPERLILTVASPLPADTVRAIVLDVLGEGKAAPARGPYPAPRPGNLERPEIPADARQVTVLFGRRVEVPPGDRVALDVALDVLSDRMVAEIRERRGLAYGLGAGASALPDGSWLVGASVGTRPANRGQVEALLRELLAGLATTPPTPDELARVRARNRRSTMLRTLDAAARAYRVGRALLEGGASPLLVDDAARGRVTPADVSRVAGRYLAPGGFLVVVAP